MLVTRPYISIILHNLPYQPDTNQYQYISNIIRIQSTTSVLTDQWINENKKGEDTYGYYKIYLQ
jgi:hypothetical protein